MPLFPSTRVNDLGNFPGLKPALDESDLERDVAPVTDNSHNGATGNDAYDGYNRAGQKELLT
jgi:hypothetical protein